MSINNEFPDYDDIEGFEDLLSAKLCVIDEGQLLTPNNCGCSPLACSIVNETFLELDGFAAMRSQMKDSSYTAEQFAGELARIADRAIKSDKHVSFALEVLRIMSADEWNSDTTQAIAEAAENHGLSFNGELTECGNCGSLIPSTDLDDHECVNGSSDSYCVTVQRVETYTATTIVKGNSAQQAKQIIEQQLADGWDAVFDGEDGSYDDCESSVVSVVKTLPVE